MRRLVAVAPAHVRVHRAALDRARPDQRDLHHQVVELPGPQPGQGRHLGPRLDLEHPDGVGRAQHVVDGGSSCGIVCRLQLDAVMRRHQLETVPQRRQHAQAEQVELDQPGIGAVVLVPLQHRAARHPRPLHRAHLPDRPVADHHPAGMDAEVTGQPLHPGGELGDRLRDACVGRDRLARP